MSKHEDIVVALFAVLSAADTGMTRNENLAVPDNGVFGTLRDGHIEETDVFFNGPASIYEFTMSLSLMFLLSVDGLEAAMDAKIDANITLLETVMDNGGLGGLITDLRVEPPDFAPRELFGASAMRGAELTIEIDFWSAHSSG